MKTHWISDLRKFFGYRMPRTGKLAHELFFRLAPRRCSIELFPGIQGTLDLTDAIQRATLWSGHQYEAPTAEILKTWADQGATHMFDIGANYGFFSYLIKNHSPSIEVTSFEPNPPLYQKLNQIISENGLPKMRAVPFGLSNTEAVLPLHIGIEDSGHTTFGAHPGLAPTSEINVRVLPFEKWIKEENIPEPTERQWMAKMDVEGFELAALQGMEKYLKARAFIGLVVEINDFTLKFCNSSSQEVLSFLESCGYRALSEGEIKTHYPLTSTANMFFVPK